MPFCLSKLQIPCSSILSEMQAFEQRTKYFSPEDEGSKFSREDSNVSGAVFHVLICLLYTILYEL